MNAASKGLVEVGISMVLRDQFTRESGRISQSFRSMLADMDTAARAYRSSFGDVSDLALNMVGGMYEAYKYSAGVQNEVFLASKMANATTTEYKDMLKTAQEVNALTPLSAMDVASGERFLAMAGNSAEEIQNMIGPAAKLASIFSVPLGGKGGVADMITNIMAGFGYESSKTAEVANDLMVATTSANMSLDDLMATVRYSVADMAAAGVSMRELAAATGALGDVGIQGTMAGTSLGNMIRYLQLSLSGQKKYGFDTLTELGLSVDNFYDKTTGKFLGLHNAFQQFLGAYQGMSQMGRTQDFYNIFGVRGMRGIIPILEAMARGDDKMGEILQRYDERTGVLDKTLNEWLKSNQGIIDAFDSSLENLKTTFGELVATKFSPVLQFGTDVIDQVNQTMQTPGGAFVVKSAVSTTMVTAAVLTLKGILIGIKGTAGYLSMLQANSTAQTAGIEAISGVGLPKIQLVLSQGFDGIEAHLRVIQSNQVKMIAAQRGFAFNSAGQLIDPKTGRYVKSKGKDFGTVAGTILMGNWGFDEMGPNRAAQETAEQMGRKTLGRSILTVIGKGAGLLARAIPYLGIAITAVDILSNAIQWLNGSVDENTQAQKEANLREQRKRDMDIWYEAIKRGVEEGMRGSGIGITVNGDQVGMYTPGTQMDYTGGLLIGQ